MKTALIALAGLAVVAFATPTFLTSQSAQAQSPLPVDCHVEGTIPIADDAPVTPDLATVSPADAEAAALAAVPGATLVDVDLEEEDGFLVYEVDLVRDRAEVDVTVDAGSGEILCTEED